MRPSLALIGCGKMGQALLDGWLSHHLEYDIHIFQPAPIPDHYLAQNIKHSKEPISEKTFDIIVLAIKPQILNKVCELYRVSVHDTTLVLSIAAGKSIKSVHDIFGAAQPIIRAMPNTPAAIGKGMTALCPNQHVSPSQIGITTQLFNACGDIVWINDEAQMDSITAISGSGPAYLFYLIEALSIAAQDLGLSPETATKIARQTMIGAAALAESQPEHAASLLRENVTSPGGTTSAALDILMHGEWQDILTKATQAAKIRSNALSS